MLYKHISARPVEQLDAALNRGIYELVGADEQGICRPRTASKQLSSVATESLAIERNRDFSPTMTLIEINLLPTHGEKIDLGL